MSLAKHEMDKGVLETFYNENGLPFHRNRSWDYCYKAFAVQEYNETLSLHLAFYLASWGMYRGSAGLLQTNYKIHEEPVKILLEDEYRVLRCSEEKEVNEDVIKLMDKLKEKLCSAYKIEYKAGKCVTPTDTLISKILLGIHGCVPAYDDYFIKGISSVDPAYKKFTSKSLIKLLELIQKNKAVINAVQEEQKKQLNLYHPNMKIIDAYFWQLGKNKYEEEKQKLIPPL